MHPFGTPTRRVHECGAPYEAPPRSVTKDLDHCAAMRGSAPELLFPARRSHPTGRGVLGQGGGGQLIASSSASRMARATSFTNLSTGMRTVSPSCPSQRLAKRLARSSGLDLLCDETLGRTRRIGAAMGPPG